MQVVIIQGDALFRSGHSDVNDAYISLIDRIASVMNRLPGDIVVRGYTIASRSTRPNSPPTRHCHRPAPTTWQT
jgi:flagellar motor protein MotB